MRKVLVIANDLEMGGIQKSLIEFLKYLISCGFDTELLIWKDGILSDAVPSGVKVLRFDYAKTRKEIFSTAGFQHKMQMLPQYLKYIVFAKLMKKPWLFFPKPDQSYDVAISYTHNGFARFYAIDRVVAEKKYLWYHHGSYDSKGNEAVLDQKYYPYFHRIVTVSGANKRMLEDYFPPSQHQITVVPNMMNAAEILSLSEEKVADFRKEEGVFSFLTVSRFSHEKGIALAVDIATELKKHGLPFKWYFIGDGETYDEVSAVITERGMQETCILLGSRKNPYPYMRQTDFYIQTSYVESQSITIYEALILKKIIVTSDLPALREVLRDGDLGVLCTPEVSAFVENIMYLVRNPSAQHKLLQSVAEYRFSNDLARESINTLLK